MGNVQTFENGQGATIQSKIAVIPTYSDSLAKKRRNTVSFKMIHTSPELTIGMPDGLERLPQVC